LIDDAYLKEGYMIAKTYRYLIFVIACSLVFCSSAFADTRLINSTRVMVPNARSYTYTTLMVNFTLSSPIGVAYCDTSTTMVVNFLICPPNSTKNSTIVIASGDVQNSLCNRANVFVGSGIWLRPSGNKGVQLSGVTCTVPVGAWIPSSVLATIGTNTSTAVIILGESVYINFQNGTIPYVQPDATKPYFDLISGNWGQIGGSSDQAAFLRKLLPSGFNNISPRFTACTGQPPGGGSWCN
jgi:hypothetical protein